MNNNSVLITGGGSGIGKSICLRLAQEGYTVLVVDIDILTAQETVREIVSMSGNASAFECDLSQQSQVMAMIETILASHRIDILINCAGIAHIGNIEHTSEEDMDRLYAVNVKGMYNAMFAVIPSMKAQGCGIIINLASIASSVGIADRFAYSMTKGSVLTMTYSVARDYINDGIRCNCISPARVHTPFVDNFLEKNYPGNQGEMFAKLSASQPIGRMAKAEEVAGLAAYLCSNEASFITGSNFPIDGGFVTLNN